MVLCGVLWLGIWFFKYPLLPVSKRFQNQGTCRSGYLWQHHNKRSPGSGHLKNCWVSCKELVGSWSYLTFFKKIENHGSMPELGIDFFSEPWVWTLQDLPDTRLWEPPLGIREVLKVHTQISCFISFKYRPNTGLNVLYFNSYSFKNLASSYGTILIMLRSCKCQEVSMTRCRICGWDKTCCITPWTHLVNRENFTKHKIRVLNNGMASVWSYGNKGDANVLDFLVIFFIVKLICTNMVIFLVLFVMHKDRLSNTQLGNCLVYCASSFKV